MICKLLQPSDLLGAVCGGALSCSLLGWLSAALWHLPFHELEKQTKEKIISLVGAAVAVLKPHEGIWVRG
jgi:hypothetical protein